jgi:hypothetical protein
MLLLSAGTTEADAQQRDPLRFIAGQGSGAVSLAHASETELRFEIEAAPPVLSEDCTRTEPR